MSFIYEQPLSALISEKVFGSPSTTFTKTAYIQGATEEETPGQGDLTIKLLNGGAK